MVKTSRPLSPHLDIYKFYLTMAVSIANRAAGCVLAASLVLFTWWLTSLASGEEAFAAAQAVTNSFFGGFVLFALTFCVLFHGGNGIRHLLWDMGYGFEKDAAQKSGAIVIIGAAVLTVIIWLLML